MNEALRAALGYAARGWHVIPIRPGAKVPLTEHGVHDAATDDVTLRSWWSRWPAAALGIACGPSRLLVVDLDGTHAVDAWRTLREQAGDASRPTLTARTGRGWHLYYAAPRITDLGNTAGRVAPGIDTRASGGYVLAPPSLHPNWVRYEVRTPGLQALNDIPMTLPEAIGRAGGVTALADRSAIAVTRGNTTAVVNLPQLTARGINPTSILLRNGDLVRVLGREEAKVFVMGEVLRPSSQTLRNGRLTLNEALGDAGGVSQVSADPRQIFVVRAANTETPEIYHLDARSPTAFALAEGFELKARDVVYVDPVPLVRWNRVISLILPSAAAVTTTRNALN